MESLRRFVHTTSKGEEVEHENPFGVDAPANSIMLELPSGEQRHVLHFLPPGGQEVQGTVLFLHGYGGSARRWQHVAKWHTDAGFQVYSMDQAYHGDNEANVYPGWKSIHKLDSFQTLVNDAIELTRFVEREHPGLGYVVHGHSMGGLVWILALLEIQDSWKGRGAILCAPALRMLGQGISPNTLLPYTPWFKSLTSVLDFVTAGYFPNPAASASKTACLPAVQRDIQDSKKLFGTTLCVRFWIKFRDASESAYKQLENIRVPLLILHGDRDTVTALSGSQDLATLANSDDVSLHIIKDGYHEIMNGPVLDRVAIEETICTWIAEHL